MKHLFKPSKIIKVFITILLSVPSFGQTNTIKILEDLGTRYDYAHAIAIRSDGKLVIAGDAYGIPCILQYDTTGELDPTFGSEGIVLASWDCGSNPSEVDVVIQPDGKILMGTSIYHGDNQDFIVARYNMDGHLQRSMSCDRFAIRWKNCCSRGNK